MGARLLDGHWLNPIWSAVPLQLSPGGTLASYVSVPVARAHSPGHPRRPEVFRPPVEMAAHQPRLWRCHRRWYRGHHWRYERCPQYWWYLRHRGAHLTSRSASHAFDTAAPSASGAALMVNTRSISKVTPRVSLDRPGDMRTLTQSRGWFRPRLRNKPWSTWASGL